MYLACLPAKQLSGELIIDHRQGQGIDGKQGTIQRFKIRWCVHCRRMIALFKRAPCGPAVPLANVDIARATPIAQETGTKFWTSYRCPACHARICRRCTREMELNGGTCPGPFEQRVERAARDAAYREQLLASGF